MGFSSVRLCLDETLNARTKACPGEEEYNFSRVDLIRTSDY